MSDLASYRLSTATRRRLTSLVPVVCPPDWQAHCAIDELLSEIELGLRSMPPLVRRALIAGLWAYDLLAILFCGSRAQRLSPDRAAAWFDRFRHGLALQRELAKGMRAIVAMSYYEMPGVLGHMGYTPEAWIAMVKARRDRSYAADIDEHERSLFERDPVPLPSEVEDRLQAVSS